MANPTTVSCLPNRWTKVATNVYRGNIFIQDPVGFLIYGSYRLTGGNAPTTIDDATESTLEDRFLIESTQSERIDVYIWPVNVTADVKVSAS